MGLFSKKSGRSRSILKKQKVSSGAGASPINFGWSFAAKALLTAALGFVVWGLGLRFIDKVAVGLSYLNSVIVLSPVEWKIEVTNGSGHPMPDDVRNDIYRVAQRALKSGSGADLVHLARQIDQMGTLDNVRIIRPVSDTILISASLRQPVMLADIHGKIRLLTSDGTLYGEVTDQASSPYAQLPLVTGIFEARATPSVDSGSRFSVSAEDRSHLIQAVELAGKSAEYGLEIKKIHYQRFRGFSLTTGDGSEIVVGLGSFDYKVKKLKDILDGLKRDGVVASRIELDYEGKAFIKERRL